MTTATMMRTDRSPRDAVGVAPGADEVRSARRAGVVDYLKQLLVDTFALRGMYRRGGRPTPARRGRQGLLDKHFAEQSTLVGLIAERVGALEGVRMAGARAVVGGTLIPPMPEGPEGPATQIARLLQAHEIILATARALAREAARQGEGADALLGAKLIGTHEAQVWSLFMHFAGEPTRPGPSAVASGMIPVG